MIILLLTHVTKYAGSMITMQCIDIHYDYILLTIISSMKTIVMDVQTEVRQHERGDRSPLPIDQLSRPNIDRLVGVMIRNEP